MNAPISEIDAVIPDAFDALSAEHERAWLHKVFVEPAGYSIFAGMRSIIVFGDSGSGKSALRMTLTRQVAPPDAPPTHLVIDWQPMPLGDVSGSPAVRLFARQVFAAGAHALRNMLGQHPQLYYDASSATRNTIHWFIQRFLASTHLTLIELDEETFTSEGLELCRKLTSEPAPEVLYRDATEQRVIAVLANCIERMKLRGVWVAIDNFGPWLRSDPASVTSGVIDILSTLELFEIEGFSFKVFAPNVLEEAFADSGGVIRNRVDIHTLTWTPERLQTIVERRIAAKIGAKQLQMHQFCEEAAEDATSKDKDRTIIDWLTRYGGGLPREWLRLTTPFVEIFARSGSKNPLNVEQWRAIRREYPPRLRVDGQVSQVYIGEAEITGIQPSSYRLLHYLYERRKKRVSRSELYFCAYKGLAAEPRAEGDKGWEDPASWSNTLDNAILRLRKAIEPDPGNPVYVLVDRGWGVKLEHTR